MNATAAVANGRTNGLACAMTIVPNAALATYRPTTPMI